MSNGSAITSFEPNNLADNPMLQITAEKLNGKNFLEWSLEAMRFLRCQKKMGYIMGTVKAPETSDPLFESWDAENAIVMSWLLNSMQPDIRKPYLFLFTAKDLWDALVMRYSKKSSVRRIFELKQAIRETKQGDMDVLAYFNKLKILWQELDNHQYWQMESASDAAKMAEMLEREKVYEFLAGLKPEFDEVRSLILGRETALFLYDVFSMIQVVENLKSIMIDGANNREHSTHKAGGNKEKDENSCNFCNNLNHARACRKLHGKRTQICDKCKNRAKTNQQASETCASAETSESSLFSKKQLKLLYKLAGKTQVAKSTSCACPESGSSEGEDDGEC